jgi:hypothetical protein
MLSPEGAAQSILQIGFSVAPSGLFNFLILTPGLRPGLFSAAPFGAEIGVSRQKPVKNISNF